MTLQISTMQIPMRHPAHLNLQQVQLQLKFHPRSLIQSTEMKDAYRTCAATI